MKAKKTIAGVLALSMLATVSASMQVFAASNTVTLEASDETVAAAGDSFSVDVTIADVPSTKVNTLDFALTYNTDVLTITSVAIGAAADTDVSGDMTAVDAPVFAYSINDGEIAVSWTTALDSDAWIADDGVVLTVNGTVNSDVAAGTETPIEFAPVDRETYDGSGVQNSSLVVAAVDGTDRTECEVETVAGSVTVSDTGTTETTTLLAETITQAPTTTEGSGETTSTPSTGISGGKLGDVNLDGNVNMTDVVCLSKAAVKLMDLSENGKLNGDVNLDGYVDSTDALILLKFQVQEIDGLLYTD
ncbi:MAG: dockerin type I domain-containing protein [Ruminococcus sp.]|nr:dockerin type I domain-containing protein [Ruminococcus sp.]